MDAHAASSRSNAAAWAWYQHSSCHLGPSARRESFASAPDRRPRPPPSPSRFKLEAALPLASIINRKTAVEVSASLEAEGVVSFLLAANLRTDVTACPTEIDPPWTSAAHVKTVPLPPDDDGVRSSSTNLVLALSHPGVSAWDCGSSLFDSFELVAVSKKLECAHQLNAFFMDKVCPPAPDITSGALDDRQQEEVQSAADSVEVLPCNEPAVFLPTAWVNVEEPIGIPPHGQINSRHPIQIRSTTSKTYDSPGPRMNCGPDDDNYDAAKKPKPAPASRQSQHHMPRLHSLSKAFHRIFALLAHSSSAAHQEHSISQRSQLQSHVPSPKTQQLLAHYNRIGVEGTASNPPSACPFRDRAPCPEDDICNRNNKHSDHMQEQQHHHHYNHHHYYYFFHHNSDESFGALQPTLAGAGKSLMVAAAGLRTPKVSALQCHHPFDSTGCKMDGAMLDCKRKWRDQNAASPTQSEPASYTKLPAKAPPAS